jgi:hypothetical protein
MVGLYDRKQQCHCEVRSNLVTIIIDEKREEIASSFLLAMTYFHFSSSPSADKLRVKAGRTMEACAVARALANLA